MQAARARSAAEVAAAPARSGTWQRVGKSPFAGREGPVRYLYKCSVVSEICMYVGTSIYLSIYLSMYLSISTSISAFRSMFLKDPSGNGPHKGLTRKT